MIDTIFNAIRADSLLGRNTCSCVDETYTDQELRAAIARGLEDGTYKTVRGALDWFVYLETVHAERCGLFDTEWHAADIARVQAGRECYGQ